MAKYAPHPSGTKLGIADVVTGFQWWRHGDHPDDHPPGYAAGSEPRVVRYFRHPSVPGTECCRKCSFPMNQHGWIDDSRNYGKEYTVCPGDHILEFYPGRYEPFDTVRLAKCFTLIEP